MAHDTDWDLLHLRAGQLFTPAAPIDKADLFAGRHEQISAVIDTINQRGQHAIIYGERGAGKTSLANIIAETLQQLGSRLIVPHITCDAGDDYRTVWRKVFGEVRLVRELPVAGFGNSSRESLAELAQEMPAKFSTGDVRQILEPLAYDFAVVVIIDEFDRLAESSVRAMIADTIKMLSDHSSSITMVLVGVADTVTDLLKEHASIDRSLIEILMPRMSQEELSEIIDKGLAGLTMSITPEARGRITGLSRGLPHYTHLLGKHAARSSIARRSLEINLQDTRSAIEQAFEEAKQSRKEAYRSATYSPKKDALFRHALLACALTETDEMGYFQPVDVKQSMSMLLERPCETSTFHTHLVEFCGDRRGRILERTGGDRRWKYRFRNPLMQPHVILQGHKDGMISD